MQRGLASLVGPPEMKITLVILDGLQKSGGHDLQMICERMQNMAVLFDRVYLSQTLK